MLGLILAPEGTQAQIEQPNTSVQSNTQNKNAIFSFKFFFLSILNFVAELVLTNNQQKLRRNIHSDKKNQQCLYCFKYHWFFFSSKKKRDNVENTAPDHRTFCIRATTISGFSGMPCSKYAYNMETKNILRCYLWIPSILGKLRFQQNKLKCRTKKTELFSIAL